MAEQTLTESYARDVGEVVASLAISLLSARVLIAPKQRVRWDQAYNALCTVADELTQIIVSEGGTTSAVQPALLRIHPNSGELRPAE